MSLCSCSKNTLKENTNDFGAFVWTLCRAYIVASIYTCAMVCLCRSAIILSKPLAGCGVPMALCWASLRLGWVYLVYYKQWRLKLMLNICWTAVTFTEIFWFVCFVRWRSVWSQHVVTRYLQCRLLIVLTKHKHKLSFRMTWAYQISVPTLHLCWRLAAQDYIVTPKWWISLSVHLKSTEGSG